MWVTIGGGGADNCKVVQNELRDQVGVESNVGHQIMSLNLDCRILHLMSEDHDLNF